MKTNKTKTLAEIRDIISKNRVVGRHTYAGLEDSEIGEYNRALMFGDKCEAFPSREEWQSITD